MQQIVPIQLRWKISPTTDTTLLVIANDVETVAIVEYLGSDAPGKEYVEIRVEFRGVIAARTHPHNESMNFIDGRFDMSQEIREELGMAPVHYGRFWERRARWLLTGTSPASGIYNVVNSDWRVSLGLSSGRHYLIAGGERTIEIISEQDFNLQPIAISEFTKTPPANRKSPPE